VAIFGVLRLPAVERGFGQTLISLQIDRWMVRSWTQPGAYRGAVGHL
jgi:hypothetical protein